VLPCADRNVLSKDETTMLLLCTECQAIYDTRAGDRSLYCSNACRQRAYRARVKYKRENTVELLSELVPVIDPIVTSGVWRGSEIELETWCKVKGLDYFEVVNWMNDPSSASIGFLCAMARATGAYVAEFFKATTQKYVEVKFKGMEV